jgi:flagellar capping protein FliD
MNIRLITPALAAALLFAPGVTTAAETKSATAQPPASSTKAAPPAKKTKPIDVNTATAAQLKTIPGIGDAEADKIIKNRPYLTRSHLVTKEVLSYDAYMVIKDKITAIPPKGEPKPRK